MCLLFIFPKMRTENWPVLFTVSHLHLQLSVAGPLSVHTERISEGGLRSQMHSCTENACSSCIWVIESRRVTSVSLLHSEDGLLLPHTIVARFSSQQVVEMCLLWLPKHFPSMWQEAILDVISGDLCHRHHLGVFCLLPALVLFSQDWMSVYVRQRLNHQDVSLPAVLFNIWFGNRSSRICPGQPWNGDLLAAIFKYLGLQA